MCENKYSQLDYNQIGQRIKLLRDKMQQSEFAKLFGLEQQDISKIENAKVKPSPDLLFKISVHFKKPMEWILTGPTYTEANNLQLPIHEPHSSYLDSDILIRKTAKVLRSDTSFRKALDSNIEAFHEAVVMREELDIAKAELADCRHQIAQQNHNIETMREQHAIEMQELRDQINKMQNKLPPAANET